MMGEAAQGEDRQAQLRQFLMMALKEQREAFGMRPDRDGYVSLMDLMGAILEEPDFSWVTVRDVEEVVGASSPPVFEISGRRIRVAGSRPRSAQARKRRRRRKPKTKKPSKPTPAKAARTASTQSKTTPGDGQPKAKKRRRRRRRKPKSKPKSKPQGSPRQ